MRGAKVARARRGWGHIRRLPSGRYQASYEGPDLTRHTAPDTFSAKQDAEEWLTRERRVMLDGGWVAPSQRGRMVRRSSSTRWHGCLAGT